MSTRAPYGRIERSLWTDPGFRALTAEERLVYLYLLTGPHAHMSGLSQLSLSMIADDLNLELEVIRAAIAGPLSDRVEYDDRTRELFVADAGRVQVGPDLREGDNRRVAIERHVEGVHSERLVRRFLDTYGAAWDLAGGAPSQAPSEPLRSPSGAPREPLRSPSEAIAVAGTRTRAGAGAGAGAITAAEQEQDLTAAGHSTETETANVNDADRGEADSDLRDVARRVAKPNFVDRWVTWLSEKPDERIPLACGLRRAVDTRETGWERGELFATPEVFDKCPGLRGTAESAYWHPTDRTGKSASPGTGLVRAGDVARGVTESEGAP